MREVLHQVQTWLGDGHKVAVATVVRVVKSAPRQPGAVMAVSDHGEVIGSVSGGCVESALYDEAQQVLADGLPRLVTYGIADDQAFEVGLTCGGTIEVFVERLDWAGALLPTLAASLQGGGAAVIATVVSGPDSLRGAKLIVPEAGSALGSTGSSALDAALEGEARAMLRVGSTGLRRYGPHGQEQQEEVTVFMESFVPPPQMIVFGAIDFAVAAVRMGKFLGYRVILCDARPVFATRARFPEADEIVVAWPHEYLASTVIGPRDAILALTHDSKFDVPALQGALRSAAGYIGALGSRATHEKRARQLVEAGVPAEDLSRICSPIGLDLGGKTPEEAAVSIAAEIIALRNGRTGGRLGQSAGRIHA